VNAPVVAAADGSEESLAATAWAAVAAARRHEPLCIVHVVDTDPGPAARTHVPGHPLPSRFRHDLPHHATSVLAKASRRAAGAAPGIDLRAAAVYGHAGQVLTAITTRASLLAVGKRGAARLPGAWTDSVALHLASSARCPVVFVPAVSSALFSEIVVGTDGSDDAAAALEFGFGEANTRHASLTALHIWALPQTGRLERYPNWMLSVGPPNASAVASLAGQVAPWRQKYPDVLVTEGTVHGQPGRVLTAFSGHAGLVVIAGGGVRPRLAPGSGAAADSLLHHAQCPVAVTPGSLRATVEADDRVLLSA
jgi:nucleotide-binding universal stress UspA family protein